MQILGPLSIFTFIPNPVLAIGPFLRLLLQPCYMKKNCWYFWTHQCPIGPTP